MSEALERVIAEQQKRIDSLEAQLKSSDNGFKYRHIKAEEFGREVANYQAHVLRTVITTPENRELWMKRNTDLRQAIKSFGYCVDCGCMDYCQCDDGCSC